MLLHSAQGVHLKDKSGVFMITFRNSHVNTEGNNEHFQVITSGQKYTEFCKMAGWCNFL